MRQTTPHRCLLIISALALTSSAALAQTESAPPQAGTESTPQAAASEGAEGSTDAATPEAADPAAEVRTQHASSAGAHAIARWMRAIGGRICMGPKLDSGTRVSRPNPNDAAQGWRVSVPTFAFARMSAPPKRAHQPTTTETPGETATEQVLATGEGTSEIPD
ncbi:MAG: hypothetical protein ACF8R9_09305 [Phycisphaerales bacterium JB054]